MSESEGCLPKQKYDEKNGSSNLFYAAVMAFLGGFGNGYTANMGSVFIKNLQDDGDGFSHRVGAMVIGSLFLGGAIGSPLAGWLCDVKGRKLTAMLGEALILSSSLIALMSPNPWYIATLRFITGIGVGACPHGAFGNQSAPLCAVSI